MPQNYFVTHCDINYLVYAERLFASLKKHSKYRIIFFAIDFDYVSKFDNVDVIRCNSKKELDKNALTFIKSSVCAECLNLGDHNYCYLDSDCLALSNCDDIFRFVPELEDYPLIYRSSRDFLIKNSRGNPFIDENETIDWNKTLEAPLLKFFGLPVEIRGQYGQTGVILFNNRSRNLINEWVNLCNNEQVLKNQDLLAPFLDETTLNVLLWKNNKLKKLPQVLINIPYEVDGVAEPDIKLFNFVENIKNPKDKEYYTSTFCRIPSKADIGNLMFLHGKISEEQNRLLNLLLEKKKIVFIQAHASSGGEPAYNLYLLNKLLRMGHEVLVIEWALYSDEYVVHRNKIISLLDKDHFVSLGPLYQTQEESKRKQEAAKTLVSHFNPDLVYLSAPPERFSAREMPVDFIEFVYKKDRPYLLVDTIHDSVFDITAKKYWPDEIWTVTQWHQNKVKNLPYCKSRLIEMELEEKSRPNRTEALKKLNLDPSYFYVLHPALFHYNKNQAYSFELARNLLDRKVKVLFAGNFCFLNELNLVKPDNAILLGEINNLDDYYSCVDLCILPSIAELNPIVIKESISHQLLCYVSDLEVYKPKYINHPLIRFIQGDNLFNYIVQNSEPKDPTAKIESKPYFFVENQMVFSFCNGARIEILGSFDYNYLVQFIDQDTGAIAYQTNIRNNMWSLCNPVYFVNWKVVVTNLVTKQVTEHKLDLRGKKVRIVSESSSLGDNISWCPSISRFATKHNIIVDYFTAKHDLFSGQYDNVRFYPYSDKDKSKDYYATYSLVCDHDQNPKYCKKDWRKISLQNFPAEVLGLEYKEERAKINSPPTKKKKFEKYVCLATQSTLQNRYYNNKYGWRDIVRYLRQLGYKIVVIDKHMQFGSKESMNTVPDHDYFAGNDSFNDIINLIRGADFCLTLSSGLSWLSWTLNKPTIVISGAVESWYEFSNPYRVQSQSKLCSGCFNRSKLDPSDWLFCPDKKDFACTKSITFEMVKEKIDELIKDLEK